MSKSTMKYDDSGWRRFRARIDGLHGTFVRVGVLASKGGNSPHGDGDEITMLELAAIHEFGSPAANIPERSFIRRTFGGFKNIGLEALCAKLVKAVMRDKISVRNALEILGAWGVAQVRKTITSGPHIPPPLQPETIERKGSTRPLMDTGRLNGAISYEVSMTSGSVEV